MTTRRTSKNHPFSDSSNHQSARGSAQQPSASRPPANSTQPSPTGSALSPFGRDSDRTAAPTQSKVQLIDSVVFDANQQLLGRVVATHYSSSERRFAITIRPNPSSLSPKQPSTIANSTNRPNSTDENRVDPGSDHLAASSDDRNGFRDQTRNEPIFDANLLEPNARPTNPSDHSEAWNQQGTSQPDRHLQELRIDSSHIKSIDSDRHIIYLNLNRQQVLDAQNLNSTGESATKQEMERDRPRTITNEAETIQLLEEKLLVHHSRHKVGEIVVYKTTETSAVEVPVQRETLVVKKVGEETPLSEVPLGETYVNPLATGQPVVEHSHAPLEASADTLVAKGQMRSLQAAIQCLTDIGRRDRSCHQVYVTLALGHSGTTKPVRLEFEQPTTAAQMLTTIAAEWSNQCQQVSLEFCVTDHQTKERYQQWMVD